MFFSHSRLSAFFQVLRFAVAAAALGASLLAQTPPAPGRGGGRAFLARPEITAQRGVVAAGRHYAVDAGMRMLHAGGNAFDAGVAAVFAAAVTEFNLFGFGGEAPCVIYDAKSGKVVVISGQGPAPKLATPALYEKQGWVDGNGPHGATLPAVMDAMAIVLQRYGTMSLEQVMQPAIEYTAEGFVMYEYLQRALVSNQKATEAFNEWGAKVYYPTGTPTPVGEIFRQPYLAATLRTIVAGEVKARKAGADRIAAIRAGRDKFYKGDIARRMIAAMKEAGGVMSYEDLATYEGTVEEPAHTSFHGFDIYKAGAWNQGPVLLQNLNILEAYDLKAKGFGSAEHIHTVIESMKLSYADRNAHYGDPLFAKVPLAGLLSKEYAAERRKLIAPLASLEHRPGDPYPFDSLPRPAQLYVPRPQGNNRGPVSDTTSLSVADAQGNLFSCTPSSGWLGGGAFIAGDTGVPMSNRMTIFDLDPLSPNFLVGGKRPRSTLTPSIVMKEGKPYMAIGTPGADNQDQQILNVLVAHIVFGMGLQESIEAPRIQTTHFHASFRSHNDDPGAMQVEDRISPEVRAELVSRGHKLRVMGPYGASSGIVIAAVRPDTGTLVGAADPRRERWVMGW